MAYQLVTFAEGGAVRGLTYVYDAVTKTGMYSLLQNDGTFKQSSNALSWTDRASIGDTGDFQLVYGAGKYAAALSTMVYLYSESENTWSNNTVNLPDEEIVRILPSIGGGLVAKSNSLMLVTDYTDVEISKTYSLYRTYNSVTANWNTPVFFDLSKSEASVQNAIVLDVVPLTSGLFAALLQGVGLVDGQITTTTSTTTTTTSLSPYSLQNYVVQIFSIDNKTGTVSVLYNLSLNAFNAFKLIQVRSSLYVASEIGLHYVKLNGLTALSEFNQLYGVDIPDFTSKNVMNVASDGRLLLVNTYNPTSDMDDLLYVYNPSTRVWTEADIYTATGMPRPTNVSYEQILSFPGQVIVFDGENDVYTTSNLKSWQYIEDTLISSTGSNTVFYVNNRLFLEGLLGIKNYLIVNEKVTRRSTNFVPKCN